MFWGWVLLVSRSYANAQLLPGKAGMDTAGIN